MAKRTIIGLKQQPNKEEIYSGTGRSEMDLRHNNVRSNVIIYSLKNP